MEITLEKVELVKDRTGVSYKEAKDALEASEGNVVDAIIAIEETINMSNAGKMNDQASQMVERIKEAVKKGNISRIKISKDDEVVLNLPVNVGIVGTVLAPWAAVIGAIAAFGTKCKVELVKDDGEIIDISEKAGDKFGDVVDKGSDIADTLKEKGSVVYDSVRSKTKDAIGKSKRTARAKSDDFKDTVDEMWEEAKKRVEKAEDNAAEVKESVSDVADSAAGDVKETAKTVKKTASATKKKVTQGASKTASAAKKKVAKDKDVPKK
ncbi:MAG: DUF4342 domain-containing protein [Clostridiales Family XIII bacterium]|jgi:vacuolar-type H+-ATPase subunit H|nr:DUF4342 domain-containing protein [Clostridiales Family XIII bacterium]